MPIYEYECSKCGKTIEVIQKMSDKPLKKHAGGCGGTLTKLISASGFQFKGTGWYVTDYGRKGAKTDTKESSAESSDSKETKSKDTSSNGSKESSSGKTGAEKAGKDSHSSKSSKKD